LSTASLPAEVFVAEALGNETLVRLKLDDQELVARAGADYEAAIGAQLWVRPNLARAHLFDADTQQRII
jgi:multiple sugar transport system ATP-binding protein